VEGVHAGGGTSGCSSASDILDGLWASVVVGLASTAIATLLGTLMALALARHEFRGRRLVEALLYVPIVTPEIIVGISLLSLFVLAMQCRSGWARSRWPTSRSTSASSRWW
jgi:spermidine/putrescine transport system permease protein